MAQALTRGALAVRRYSARPFPEYRFVPGRTPHPLRDPAGHSYGAAPERLERFQAERWRHCEAYLFGVDLFNHDFWWEAHEAWESVWVAAGRRTTTGRFLQGLIQVAVAHLKRHQGFAEASRRLAASGVEKIEEQQGVFLGIEVEALRRAVAESFFEGGNAPVRIALGMH